MDVIIQYHKVRVAKNIVSPKQFFRRDFTKTLMYYFEQLKVVYQTMNVGVMDLLAIICTH